MMRPKSAPRQPLTKQQKNTKQRYEDKLAKTDPFFARMLSTRKIKNKSPQSVQLQKISNVTMVKNIKHIGIVHAYKPQKLKECLVQNTKTYTNFFNKDGKCTSNQIYFRSVIAHFREWKKELAVKMVQVFDIIMTVDELVQADFQTQVMGVLNQLQEYGNNLRHSIEHIMESGSYKTQILKLYEKYQFLYVTLKHVINLVKNLFAFTKEIALYISEKEDINIGDFDKVSEDLNKIRDKTLKKIEESLAYCACHPSNHELMKIQFFTRQNVAICVRNALNMFESLREMEQFEGLFQEKLNELLRNQKFDAEYLQNVLEFLHFKNEEIKLSEKKFELNKKVFEKVQLLRAKIEEQQTQFIRKFRGKCLKYVIAQTRKVTAYQFLHLVKSKGSQYKDMKKIFLLVFKVYQQSEKQSGIDQQKYSEDKKVVNRVMTAFSNSIKTLSPSIQQVIYKLQTIQTMNQKNVDNKTVKLIQKYIEEIKKIEDQKTKIDDVLVGLVQELCKAETKPQELIEINRHKIHGLLDSLCKIIIFSRNEEINSQIFKLLDEKQIFFHSNSKIPKEKIPEIIFDIFSKRSKAHEDFLLHNLQKGITQHFSLKQLNKTEQIRYLFGQQFVYEFISNYPVLKNIVKINEQVQKIVYRTQINNAEFYVMNDRVLDNYRTNINDEIKKLQKTKSKNIFNKYIIFLYERSLIQLLNMPYLNKLCLGQDQQKVNYEDYNKILSIFIDFYDKMVGKYKKQNSMFWELAQQIYQTAIIILRQNRVISEYKQSVSTGQYYPSVNMMLLWMEVEFSYEYERVLSKEIVVEKREEMKGFVRNYIRKLQALRQRSKFYKFINSDHPIWKDINQTLTLLKQFHFEQNYNELLQKVLRYLRVKKIKHSALFASDKSLVYLTPFSNNPESMSKMLFMRMHIGLGYLNSNPTVVKQYIYDDSADILKQSIIEKAIIAQVNKNVQNNLISNLLQIESDVKEPEGMIEDIVADYVQDQIDEEVGDQIVEEDPISSKIMQSLAQDNLPQNKKQEKQSSSMLQKKQANYCYWFLPSIQSSQFLKRALAYRNNEFKSIQKNLDIETLCSITTPQGKQKIITHIDFILEQCNKSDFLKMLNLGSQNTVGQQKLIDFQDAVRRNDPDLRSRFIDIMDFFQFLRKTIYEHGINSIDAVSKQGEEICFVDVDLVQNNYKQGLAQFHVKQFLVYLWKEVKNAMKKGKIELMSNCNGEVCSFVERINKKLSQIYKEIVDGVNVAFNLRAVNPRRVQQRIRKFLEEVVNIRAFLPQPPKISTIYDVLKYIDSLSSNMNKINVIDEYWTITHTQKVLFMSQQQIQDEEVARCLLIQRIDPDFGDLIENKHQVVQIRKGVFTSKLLGKLKRQELTFQQIKGCLFYHQKTIDFYNWSQKRKEMLKLIQSDQMFLKLMEDPAILQLYKQKEQIKRQLQLLKFLQQKSMSVPQTIQNTFESNKKVKYVGKNINSKQARVYSEQQIDKMFNILKQNKIECCRLKFKDKTIGLLQNNSVEGAYNYLRINPNEGNNSNIFEMGKQEVKCKFLYITLCDIMPKQDKDQQVMQIYEDYLNKTCIEVTTNQNIQTYNSLQLFKQKRQIVIQLGWPQDKVEIKLYNAQQSLSILLLAHQYNYCSQLQPLSFQEHFNHKIREIEAEVEERRNEEEKKRKEEQAKRAEIDQENKKQEMQREIELLRLEQEKLRIQLQNEKINNQRLVIEEKSRKISWNKQKQLPKEPQNNQILIKQPGNAEPKYFETAELDYKHESQISMSIILSEGHTVIGAGDNLLFSHLKNQKQKMGKTLEYDLTLSEHMNDNREMKEVKGVEQKFRDIDNDIKQKTK